MNNIEKLYKALAEGATQFAYRKKDGSLRIAKGTTDPSQIPDDMQPKGTGTEKTNIKAYWDLNSEDWRAFNPDAVLWAAVDGTLLFSENAAMMD